MRSRIPFIFIFLILGSLAFGQSVTVKKDINGFSLVVDDKPFMVNGMNWDYFPIGTNYDYQLWQQSEETIRAALDKEMSLLQDMGVNAIRQYTGVPPKWITYIYENYGIYTMLNHSFGRYGLMLDGEWVPQTDYGDPRVKEILIAEASDMITEFKDVPGILLFLLGNENNYGLFWEGAETEDMPKHDPESDQRARDLYKLFNEASQAMKSIDVSKPIAICNGDLLYADLIKTECKDVDILGVNIYRGMSFGDFFERAKREVGLPVLLTEFGADAFDAQIEQEDQLSQAHYNLQNWKEIYENAAGMGKAGNALGGFTFQFTDGWWKYGQTKNLEVHDTNASWSNGGYASDFVADKNNMNEEWFGICAKGPMRENGTYDLTPRKAYYVLQEAHRFDPFDESASREVIAEHFAGIYSKYLEDVKPMSGNEEKD